VSSEKCARTVEDVGAPVCVHQQAVRVGLVRRRERVDFDAAQGPLLHVHAHQRLTMEGCVCKLTRQSKARQDMPCGLPKLN
jgi:hypothetical protein